MSKRPTVPRGNCPDCGYRFQLLKDGTMQAHRDPRISNRIERCPGSWQPEWSWIDDMKADALAIAAPGFELEPGDRIELDMSSSAGGHLSSVTFEPGYLRIAVAVSRPTDTGIGDPGWDGPLRFREIATGQTYYHAFYRAYLDQDAPKFFQALMQRGSGKETAVSLPPSDDAGLNPAHQIDRRMTYAIGVVTFCTCGRAYLGKFKGPIGDRLTDEQRQDAMARADAHWGANCPYIAHARLLGEDVDS